VTTADDVTRLYVAVGSQLKAIDQDRGPAVTQDLWPVFLSIRIHDAITDPIKRNDVAQTLRQLQDQLAARSR
jgi:hypothetical protein